VQDFHFTLFGQLLEILPTINFSDNSKKARPFFLIWKPISNRKTAELSRTVAEIERRFAKLRPSGGWSRRCRRCGG